MRTPSLEKPAGARAGRHAMVLYLSSLVLTTSGSDRPTTFRVSTLSYTRGAPQPRTRTSEAPSPRRPCGCLRNSLAAAGWWWSVTHEGRRQDAAGIGKERQTMPLRRRPRTDHGQFREGEPTGCSSSPRWLSARRVLPHFGHRRTSASAPLRGLPCALRAPAPRAGRRLFWAASLAPTTTKQEEQQ